MGANQFIKCYKAQLHETFRIQLPDLTGEAIYEITAFIKSLLHSFFKPDAHQWRIPGFHKSL